MPTQGALFLEKAKGNFILQQRDIPTAPAGEILVKIHATALNPIDWQLQKYAFFLKDYPAILGTDIAGEVEAVGKGVTEFKKGDRMVSLRTTAHHFSSTLSFQNIKLQRLIPDSISFDQAATIPVAFLAAVTGLFGENLKGIGAGLNPNVDWPAPQQTGQTIFVIGGSTSVGQYVIQLAKFLGFTNIIAYASQKHHSYLAELGATGFIDRAAVPLDRLDTAVSGPVEIVFDCVSSVEAQEVAPKIVSPEGAAISVNEDERSEEAKAKDKTFFAVFATSFAAGHEVFGERLWAKVERLLEERVIQPNRLEVVPGGLRGVLPGLKRLENNMVSGYKLVVHPQETE
ncbi:GroES-like protein [Cylindrobasidium torrendii FP15055 ss-10]|uniref:GroES-like protein n=1 Tax=Cylindrobasidium torrendii FP15055 ss-10 TaxID=1314674 RepID=A0A0D7B5G6_9AGAR|nr:GroES-like protein [Cylindrobasidium torrendii FP15055 ss-10]